jgi:hypothetical protein
VAEVEEPMSTADGMPSQKIPQHKTRPTRILVWDDLAAKQKGIQIN